MRSWPQIHLVALSTLFAAGCVGVPDGVEPVDSFELDRYLGRWYEIARLDNSFERGMSDVTAEYSLRDDGGVRVVNRGYVIEDDEWKETEGKAYFVGPENEGHLKVSFFGPFYGSYVVFELDTDYEYAFVCGPDRSYLWLLSRTPEIDSTVREAFVEMSVALGFDTNTLIWVDHEKTSSNSGARNTDPLIPRADVDARVGRSGTGT